MDLVFPKSVGILHLAGARFELYNSSEWMGFFGASNLQNLQHNALPVELQQLSILCIVFFNTQ